MPNASSVSYVVGIVCFMISEKLSVSCSSTMVGGGRMVGEILSVDGNRLPGEQKQERGRDRQHERPLVGRRSSPQRRPGRRRGRE